MLFLCLSARCAALCVQALFGTFFSPILLCKVKFLSNNFIVNPLLDSCKKRDVHDKTMLYRQDLFSEGACPTQYFIFCIHFTWLVVFVFCNSQ